MRSQTLSEPKKILVCGSNQDFIKNIAHVFSSTGYNVDNCDTSSQASMMIRSSSYHLILIDEKSTGLLGLQMIKQLRKFSQIPIIMLSSNPRKEIRLAAFSYGADDYLLKPFLLDEFEARAKAVIRRYTVYNKFPQVFSLGDIQIDLEYKTVTKEGKPIELRNKEYETLLLLVEHEKQILSPKQIYEVVWGEPYLYGNNTVATTIWRIRNKLKNSVSYPIIQTVKGFGYRLVV